MWQSLYSILLLNRCCPANGKLCRRWNVKPKTNKQKNSLFSMPGKAHLFVSMCVFKDYFSVCDLMLHLLFISIRFAQPFLAHLPLPALSSLFLSNCTLCFLGRFSSFTRVLVHVVPLHTVLPVSLGHMGQFNQVLVRAVFSHMPYEVRSLWREPVYIRCCRRFN